MTRIRRFIDFIMVAALLAASAPLLAVELVKIDQRPKAMALALGSGVGNMKPEEFVTDKFFNVQAD